MKTFKQWLIESESDTFVYCFGRYSPVTRGHITHFQSVKAFAEQHGFPYTVYVSRTVDNKKNPVPVEAKIHYIKKAIPDLKLSVAVNMFKLLDELIPRGYRKIIYFAGGDYFDGGSEEHKMFNRLVSYANEQGVELVAMSSGDRTPGISGTSLRQAVMNDDFKTFLQVSPIGIGQVGVDDVKHMFELTKQGLMATKK